MPFTGYLASGQESQGHSLSPKTAPAQRAELEGTSLLSKCYIQRHLTMLPKGNVWLSQSVSIITPPSPDSRSLNSPL